MQYASLDTAVQVVTMIVIMIAMMMTSLHEDFDNYEDDDYDDSDARLIEQNMAIPSLLDE